MGASGNAASKSDLTSLKNTVSSLQKKVTALETTTVDDKAIQGIVKNIDYLKLKDNIRMDDLSTEILKNPGAIADSVAQSFTKDAGKIAPIATALADNQTFAKTLPMAMVKGALKRLDMIRTMPELKDTLWKNTNSLQSGLRNAGFDLGTTQTCITPVFLQGEVPEAMALVYDLRENHGVFCSIVVYPVIPKGLIILRLIPTATHTQTDIDETIVAFSAIRDLLENGTYKKLAASMMEE